MSTGNGQHAANTKVASEHDVDGHLVQILERGEDDVSQKGVLVQPLRVRL